MSIGDRERSIITDVLVIGAGWAGFFAAIKAKEKGVDVTLADKSYVGKAGSTHFSEGDIVFFRPERGHNLKEWVDRISGNCEYINNREWDEICLTESKDRYEDLVAWGISLYQKDGKPYLFNFYRDARGLPVTYENITMINKTYAPTLREKALAIGVKVLDRIMFCELLKQDGQIAGAVGFNTTSGNLYIFKSKAVVIATGNSSLKAGSYPVHFWTGDGDAMAFKAGAELAGKEFSYVALGSLRNSAKPQAPAGVGPRISGEIHNENYNFPFAIGGNWTGWYDNPHLNAEGGSVTLPAWEAHEGRIPLYYDFDSLTPGTWEWLREFFKRIGTHQSDKIGLDPFKGGKVKWPASRVRTYSIHGGAAGVWPVDKSCATAVPGLYAAGNSCATMASGAAYAGMGFASNHAMVTGTRAGLGAAEYVSKLKAIKVDQAELKRAKDSVCAPMLREGGFSPAWVTQTLHGFMLPYFILNVKHKERLQPALALVEFLNNHIVPKLKANDAHEWRLAQETKHIALIAEMMLRASLFRTESRGNHFREDYPRRDDPTWLAWVKLKDLQGQMKLSKEPVPKEWWPDLTKPYEERYPRILPLE